MMINDINLSLWCDYYTSLAQLIINQIWFVSLINETWKHIPTSTISWKLKKTSLESMKLKTSLDIMESQYHYIWKLINILFMFHTMGKIQISSHHPNPTIPMGISFWASPPTTSTRQKVPRASACEVTRPLGEWFDEVRTSCNPTEHNVNIYIYTILYIYIFMYIIYIYIFMYIIYIHTHMNTPNHYDSTSQHCLGYLSMTPPARSPAGEDSAGWTEASTAKSMAWPTSSRRWPCSDWKRGKIPGDPGAKHTTRAGIPWFARLEVVEPHILVQFKWWEKKNIYI